MLKNASLAGKESVFLPYSKMRNAIAECLKKEGYVSNISKKVSTRGGSVSNTKNKQSILEVGLMYIDKKPKIVEVERISKQSRRVYFRIKDIHTVKNGSGLLVLSTPKGILSGREARKEQVCGEALFKIW